MTWRWYWMLALVSWGLTALALLRGEWDRATFHLVMALWLGDEL